MFRKYAIIHTSLQLHRYRKMPIFTIITRENRIILYQSEYYSDFDADDNILIILLYRT